MSSDRLETPDGAYRCDLALRCYPVLVGAKPKGEKYKRSLLPAEYVLAFDTETTTDATQQLTFGSYRFLKRCPDAEPFTYECLEEGLFYANDAPADAVDRLRAYAREHEADTSVNGERRLRVEPLSEFLRRFFRALVRLRATIAGFNLPFDISRLAFDATEGRGRAFGGFSFTLWTYRNELGIARPDRYRPRVTIRTIDSKRSIKGLAKPVEWDPEDSIPDDSEDGKPVEGHYPPGTLLELRTLTFALTDRGMTLDQACDAFGVERKESPKQHPGWDFDGDYIGYNLQDTRITGQLAAAALREYAHHPIGVAAVDVYSPASIGKGYLAAMGVTPPLRRWPGFPKPELGFAMSTFYGGRTSARIRRFMVPVRYYDFVSMYPTVNALLGTWELLTAADYRIVDVTAQAQKLLDGLTLDQLFDPKAWPRLGFFAQFVPQGDVLPVRTKWEPGDARQIGINPLTAPIPLWYAGPDIAASVLLSGKVPRLIRAFAVEPVRDANGRVIPLDGLAPIELLNTIAVDPARENFFLRVIEERYHARGNPVLTDAEQKRLDKGLKVIANSSSYGILAQLDPVAVRKKDEAKRVEVFGALGAFPTTTRKPERPGDFFFPPIAAQITAGARCMLAMLERCVTDEGGTYAMEDTDSMAIVATREGGLVPCPGGAHSWTRKNHATYTGPNVPVTREAIRALSWEQADAIAAKFETLNPYGNAVPGSILKVEDINDDEHGDPRQLWCYAISSKRYALFTLDDRGEPHVARNPKGEPHCSEHGLGHLLNPIDADDDDRSWIPNTWETIAREHFGLAVSEPEWLGRPALTRLAVSTPYLWRPFAAEDAPLPYRDRIKPFNFLLAAHLAPMGAPFGANPARFLLVAPYESDPKRWSKLVWTEVHEGREYAITTDPGERTYHPERPLVQTYRDALALFRLHPEAKSLRPDGQPCDELHKDCAGLLRRRPALASDAIDNIGKEMNELDSVLANVAHDEDELITRYRDPSASVPFDRIRVLLRCVAMPVLLTLTNDQASERTIERARLGKGTPHKGTQRALVDGVVAYFSTHPAPTFATIEQLDPQGVAAEVRELAKVIEAEASEPIETDEALDRARRTLAAGYAEQLRGALALLGL